MHHDSAYASTSSPGKQTISVTEFCHLEYQYNDVMDSVVARKIEMREMRSGHNAYKERVQQLLADLDVIANKHKAGRLLTGAEATEVGDKVQILVKAWRKEKNALAEAWGHVYLIEGSRVSGGKSTGKLCGNLLRWRYVWHQTKT